MVLGQFGNVSPHESYLRVFVDKEQLAELERILGGSDKLVAGVLRNSLNRGGSRMRTLTKRIASKKTGLKSRVVSKRIRLRRATARHLEATVYVSGRGWPAVRFPYTQDKTLGGGVTVRSGRKSHDMPGAFVAQVGGHVGIFRRRGRARLPIDEQYIEGPGRVIRRLARSVEIVADGVETARKRIPHELDRAVARLQRRAARSA